VQDAVAVALEAGPPLVGLLGLGAPPGDKEAATKCLRCGFGNIPVVEEVVWTVPLPLTAEQAQSTFGDTVNPLSGSSAVPGVASIDSTFLINGILQTDILAQGIGVHVFAEPLTFSTIGNAFVAPSSTAGGGGASGPRKPLGRMSAGLPVKLVAMSWASVEGVTTMSTS